MRTKRVYLKDLLKNVSFPTLLKKKKTRSLYFLTNFFKKNHLLPRRIKKNKKKLKYIGIEKEV